MVRLSAASAVSLLILCAAAADPTVVAKAPQDYDVANGPTPAGNEIAVETDASGVNIFLGPDRADAYKRAVDENCASLADSKCLDSAKQALGVEPNEAGLQKRFIPLVALGVAYLASLVFTWNHLITSDQNYHPVKIHFPTPTGADVDTWASATAMVFKGSDNDPTPTPVALIPAEKPPVVTPTINVATENGDKIETGDTVVDFPAGTLQFWRQAAEQAICPRSVHDRRQDPVDTCTRLRAQNAIMAAITSGMGMEIIHLGRNLEILGNDPLTNLIGDLVTWAKTLQTLYSEVDLKALVEVLTVYIYQITVVVDIDAGLYAAVMEQIDRLVLKKNKVKVKEEDEECSCCTKLEPTKYPNYDNALQAILSAKSSPPAAPPEPTYEKVCNKQLDDVRNDKSKWKWTQRDPVVAKIEEFCSQSFTGDSAEQEYEEGYENHDGFKLVARYKGINPPDKNTCIHNLRDHLVDGCDGDGRLNQYNVKWGGRRTEKPSGLEFEVIPTQTRVSTDSPNWECNTWANREQKGFKGKDGKDLPSDIDDAMMKHQCVHQLWNMGWQTKGIDCGGSYNIVLTGSNGYQSHTDCWKFNYPCIADSIDVQTGVIMTGTHWAGSAGHTKNYLGIRCWIGFDNY